MSACDDVLHGFAQDVTEQPVVKMLHYNWFSAWQNQQNDLCAHQGLRSAWASTQSDLSLRCPHEETLSAYLSIEHTAKTQIRLR